MSINNAKQNVLDMILKCVKNYSENLNNCNFLVVAQNKNKSVYTFEITFSASNFLHLTGIKNVKEKSGEAISADDFYKRCLENKISVDNFELASDGTTVLKLQVLPKLTANDLSARMIGDFNCNGMKLYTEKITGSVYGCMGFISDKKNFKNYPNTVLNEDVRNITERPDRILITYRKKQSEKLYSEIVYKAKGYNFKEIKLPEYPYLKFE